MRWVRRSVPAGRFGAPLGGRRSSLRNSERRDRDLLDDWALSAPARLVPGEGRSVVGDPD